MKLRPGDTVRLKRRGKVVECGLSGAYYIRWDDGGDDWVPPSKLDLVMRALRPGEKEEPDE